MKDNIKYNNFGSIDTDSYVEQAYELRRAYCAVAIKDIIVSIKSFFSVSAISRRLKSA